MRKDINQCQGLANRNGLTLTNDPADGDLVLTAPAGKRFTSNLSHESKIVSRGAITATDIYQQIEEVIELGIGPCEVDGCCEAEGK